MPLSEEERAQLLGEMAPDAQEENGEYKPWFPMGNEKDLGATNALRMVGNALPSAYQRLIKDPASLTTQLGPLALMMGRGIAGSGAELGRRMGYADSPNAEIFRNMMSGAAEGVSTKTMIEDPMGYLLNFSGLGGAAGRVGRMQAIVKGSQASPWKALPGALKATGKAQRAVTQGAMPEILGFTTGYEPEAFRQATQATSKGGEAAASFWKAWKGNISGRELGDEIQKAKGLLVEEKSKRYQQNLMNVTKIGDVDLGAIKTRLRDALKDMGVTMRTSPDGEFVRNKRGLIEIDADIMREGKVVGGSAIEGSGEVGNIQRLVTRVMDWEDNSLEGLDALKQRIYRIKPNRGDTHPRANKLAMDAYHDLRKELGDKYEGYNKLASEHQHFSEVIDDFGTVLSGNANNPESLLNKISKSMHDDFDIRQNVVQMLEDVSGIPIRAQLAGRELQRVAPKGLIGRAAAAGTVTAGFAMQQVMKTLPFLVVTSPKVMGAFYGAMGYPKNVVDQVTKMMVNLHRQIPEGMLTEGMTIGGLLTQIAERGGVKPQGMWDQLTQGEDTMGETVPERMGAFGGAVRGAMRQKFYGKPDMGRMER